MTVLHGQSITLTCNVTSFPISSVQWFIDGKLLQQVLPNDTYDIQVCMMSYNCFKEVVRWLICDTAWSLIGTEKHLRTLY